MVGAYMDLVRDAGVSQLSAQKYDEGAAVLRAQLSPHANFGVAAEASYQRRTYALLDEQGRLRTGQVVQLGLMPFFSPFGAGAFTRPQLRLVYALSVRDDGARSFYAAADPFSQRGVEHYLGLSVEWWFNASNQPVR
jgi:maltoporin